MFGVDRGQQRDLPESVDSGQPLASPLSCTDSRSLKNAPSVLAGASAAEADFDDSFDVSEEVSGRERLIAALTDALRVMLLEGDGEGARVAIRALDELAGLASARPAEVSDLVGERARRRKPQLRWSQQLRRVPQRFESCCVN